MADENKTHNRPQQAPRTISAVEVRTQRDEDAKDAPPPAPAAPKKAPVLLDPGDKTAKQLRDWLIGPESWTPAANLEPFTASIETGEIKSATDFYRVMEKAAVNPGTIRKAGKWIWGTQFEPEQAMAQTPTEEMQVLRDTLKNLQERILQVNADRLSLTNQLEIEREKVADLTREVSLHRLQKRQQQPELATA